MAVPEILLSGNHPAIAAWRKQQSELRSQREQQ
jgi:tRNA G37 N-methylase TrmD